MQISPGDLDDQSLMAAIAKGDRNAFSRFYDRFSPPVFAYCLRGLRDRGEAEDLLVDVFAELWDRAGRYDAGLSKPFTYLMNLARARLIDRLRRQGAVRRGGGKVVGDGAGREAEPQSPAAGPLSDAVMGEERSRVLRAMEALTAEQRSVVELSFYDALSHSEIAEKIGKPLGTVKSRIRDALAKLRDRLSGELS